MNIDSAACSVCPHCDSDCRATGCQQGTLDEAELDSLEYSEEELLAVG